MIDQLRYIVLFSFIFGVWYLVLRKNPHYGWKLYPWTWYAESRANGAKKIFKIFCFSMPIIIFLWFLLPVVNTFAETLAGGIPSVEPGENPVAWMVGVSPYLLLVAATLAPIVEEWLCRGVILEEIKKRRGSKVAVVLSASVFGLLHLTNIGYSPHSFFVPFVSGLIFGIWYLKFGLFGSWLVHGGNNFLQTVLWMVG